MEASGGKWNPDLGGPGATDNSLLVEFGGRECYQSWPRPNPNTAENMGYIDHIDEVGHTSILEQAVAAVRISEVSRSLTHELIRHRHFSVAQLSQRFTVTGPHSPYVTPGLFRYDYEAGKILEEAWEHAVAAYDALIQRAEVLMGDAGVPPGTGRRKRVREAARAVLPNMTPTSIVVSGNTLAWRHFLDLRGSIHADAEIRELSVAIYRLLSDADPNLYRQFKVEKIDGTECVIRVS